MAWKLLAFKPLKPFFFGGEKVFTNTHYAKSEYFPQQTQILGALRLYWMEQNRLMRVQKDGKYVPYEKKNKAINLVGDAGSSNFLYYDDLGSILGISPMFILQKKEECIKDALFEIPSDVIKDTCYSIAIPKKLNDVISNKPATLLKKFDTKKGFSSGLGGSEFWEDYQDCCVSQAVIEHDKIYKSYEQVGIGLEHKQTVNKQFYTKKSYMLKDSYCFGLLVNIDEERLAKGSQQTLEDGIISLGADASMFCLSVMDIPQTLQEHRLIANLINPKPPHPQKGKKIVLLNDAMLESSIQEDAFFQIVSKKIPFKTFQKRTHDKSKEKLLVPKGSVYYFDTPCSLPQAKGAYAKMGYNQYLVLN